MNNKDKVLNIILELWEETMDLVRYDKINKSYHEGQREAYDKVLKILKEEF